MALFGMKSNLIAFLQLILGAIIGVGGLIAYSEAKFASKESLVTEVQQRQADSNENKEMVRDQGKKIDRVLEILLMRGGRR